MKTTLAWRGRMAFAAKFRDHTVPMDAKSVWGGEDAAPSPKELVLAGLCGCTAMDVVSLLKKAKSALTALDVHADATQSEGRQPAVFATVALVYEAEGDVEPAALLKAVEESQTRYCGVSAMIAKTARITYEVRLNGERVGAGEARFE